MKRAAAMLASGRDQTAVFEARTRERLVVALSSASPGNESTVGATTHAALISVVAAFFTLSVHAALTFQKCRFDKGMMVGTTMAAVNWYGDFSRRKNFRPSRWTLILIATIATIATAFTVALQQAAHVLAASLPQTITHS